MNHRCAVRRGGRIVLAGALASLCAVIAAPPAAALPAFPDASKQYWFGNLRIKQVWGLGATGRGVTVAVLDSGVQADQVELRGAVLPGTDLAGGDGHTDTDGPRGHGTSMARRIAGQGGGRLGLTGIAPDAKILPVNIDTKGGDAALVDGIRYAVAHGARVINMSEGTPAQDYPDLCPPDLKAAVRYALDKGAVLVASAGNTGNTSNDPEYPGSCPGVLAVGAVDGSLHAWERTQRQSYVAVASTGVKMLDQNLAGEEGTSSGTSDSTALVSASIALVWSKLPNLTNRQVVARILATTVDDVTTKGHDPATGYGAVRPYYAITDAVPADAPNPVFDKVANSASPVPSRSATGPPSGSSAPAADRNDANSGGSSGLLVGGGIAVGVVVVLVVVAVLVARARRRPPGYPGPPWTPPGGLPPHGPPPGPPPSERPPWQ